MSRLPQLEQELRTAAARRRGPRRAIRAAVRAAPAAAALAALVTVLVLTSGEEGGPSTRPVRAEPFPPGSTLETMLGVFRRPATPRDSTGVEREELDELPDRQPGEDPTRSRRVDRRDATIFLWPMRDGVCNSVAPRGGGQGSGGGCVPLEYLRRRGVSIGVGGSRRGQTVSGVVVDGIREVVLRASGGPDLRVAVEDNAFAVDLSRVRGAVSSVRWRYAGRERSFDLRWALQPEVPLKPGYTPLEGTVSERISFSVGEARYTAVGFHARNGTICTTVTDAGNGRRVGLSCIGARGLRKGLERRPAFVFASGGTEQGTTKHTGFARGAVTELEAREPGARLVLSPPWRPWSGPPIRYFFVFTDREPRPGQMPEVVVP